MISPTQKQIELVDNMTSILGLDFPTCSREFNKFTYSIWISSHMEDYLDFLSSTIYDEDYLSEICLNDIWCEEY